jgi:hypothetical protein
MAKIANNGKHSSTRITSITVAGFKSIGSEQSIEVRPLTLLAGANSSGKSSMMQPLLLLKQTLEASYDPGPLLLNGPNIRFTTVDQMLFHAAGVKELDEFVVRIGLEGDEYAELLFRREAGKRLELFRCTFKHPSAAPLVLAPDMPVEAILSLSPLRHSPLGNVGLPKDAKLQARLVRDRCFFRPVIEIWDESRELSSLSLGAVDVYGKLLQDVIHVPGLRGNPERAYPLTATGPEFPGTFERYTAGVVAQWSVSSTAKLEELGGDLKALGLTWKVEAKELDDTRVELRVGRLRRPQQGGARDLVNIADVGFGVSQTLPVLVALLVAQPGQILYIEQPEIHLHPRAQIGMASVIAKAAKRGVHVVVETHSSLLLLGVQSQVAEGKLPSDLVKLHWFTRDEKNGATTVSSADLDEAGRFGDWPADFDDVSLKAQAHYLDTAEALLAGK